MIEKKNSHGRNRNKSAAFEKFTVYFVILAMVTYIYIYNLIKLRLIKRHISNSLDFFRTVRNM